MLYIYHVIYLSYNISITYLLYIYHIYLDKQDAIFLTLSAGSLNAPNTKMSDSRIIFECQYMINHLKQLGKYYIPVCVYIYR